MHHLEISLFGSFCLLIDLVSALIIIGYCTVAFLNALRFRTSAEAHALVAKGALLGMNVKLLAAALKTIELQSWNQISLFAAILVLRTLLKRTFQRENRIPVRSSHS
jgi:uncharacterized membrane protein